jgi:hypothetical protein
MNSSNKRLRQEEEAEEASSEKEEDSSDLSAELRMVSQLIQQTNSVLERLEHRVHADQIKQLKTSCSDQTERLIRIALRHWFANNFSSEDAQVRTVPRSQLRGYCNAFLESLHLPSLSKQDPTWSEYFLRDCVGMSEKEQRTGKQVQLHDGRNLQRYAVTLKSLLDAVHGEMNAT